jgi:hypothetical protein
MSYTTVCPVIQYRRVLPNRFFQVESSNTLDGHRDSVNAIKFNDDLSMLLSGGEWFVSSLFNPHLTNFQTTLVV